MCRINSTQVNKILQSIETQRLILVSEAMSFIKAIFWDSKVEWSLASLKAQSGPGSSLPFSLVASATFSASSPTSWSSFRFPGARVRLQVGQTHTGKGSQQVQGPGPTALHRAAHNPCRKSRKGADPRDLGRCFTAAAPPLSCCQSAAPLAAGHTGSRLRVGGSTCLPMSTS